MIKIVIFNSLGFFFLQFIINYFSSQILEVSGTEIGLIWSIQTIGFVISSTLTGLIADKTSRKLLVLIGSFGRGTSYFITFVSILYKNFTGMVFGNFILGFMAGIFWIPVDSLIADKSNKENRSSAYAKKKIATGIGMLIGGLGGFAIFFLGTTFELGDFFTFAAIPLFGCANFGAGIYFLRNVDDNIVFYDENNISEVNIDNTKLKLMPKLFLIGISILMMMLFLAYVNDSIFRPFIQVFILEKLSNDPIIILIIYLPTGIISMFLSSKIGTWIDKIDPKIGFSIVATLGAILTFTLINSDNILQFAVILIFDQAISTSAELIVLSILSKISLKNRGKVFGLKSLFMQGGKIFGPIIGGLAWDNIGMTAPFMISIIVEICLIPLFWIALKFIIPNLAEEIDIKDTNK
jgi:MFS family permease